MKIYMMFQSLTWIRICLFISLFSHRHYVNGGLFSNSKTTTNQPTLINLVPIHSATTNVNNTITISSSISLWSWSFNNIFRSFHLFGSQNQSALNSTKNSTTQQKLASNTRTQSSSTPPTTIKPKPKANNNNKYKGKVLISYINGIYHSQQDCQELTEQIQKIFKTDVRSFYYPSTGSWFQDVAKIGGSLILKSKNNQVAKLLAEHLKNVLEEVGPQGRILHIAHSAGAIITYLAARYHLTLAERQQIDVITLGGGRSITHKYFKGRIVNYYSSNDPLVIVDNRAGKLHRNREKIKKLQTMIKKSIGGKSSNNKNVSNSNSNSTQIDTTNRYFGNWFSWNSKNDNNSTSSDNLSIVAAISNNNNSNTNSQALVLTTPAETSMVMSRALATMNSKTAPFTTLHNDNDENIDYDSDDDAATKSVAVIGTGNNNNANANKKNQGSNDIGSAHCYHEMVDTKHNTSFIFIQGIANDPFRDHSLNGPTYQHALYLESELLQQRLTQLLQAQNRNASKIRYIRKSFSKFTGQSHFWENVYNTIESSYNDLSLFSSINRSKSIDENSNKHISSGMLNNNMLKYLFFSNSNNKNSDITSCSGNNDKDVIRYIRKSCAKITGRHSYWNKNSSKSNNTSHSNQKNSKTTPTDNSDVPVLVEENVLSASNNNKSRSVDDNDTAIIKSSSSWFSLFDRKNKIVVNTNNKDNNSNNIINNTSSAIDSSVTQSSPVIINDTALVQSVKEVNNCNKSSSNKNKNETTSNNSMSTAVVIYSPPISAKSYNNNFTRSKSAANIDSNNNNKKKRRSWSEYWKSLFS